MDPKAAAKSKRSQSQQGKRNHPTPSAASARSQKKKKEPLPQQKQHQNQGEQKVRADFLALPSNWDRYEENGIEADSEGVPPPPLPAARSISGDAETVAKKSRGADFGRLIADARSLIRDRDHGDIMSSLAIDYQFDEATPDIKSFPGGARLYRRRFPANRTGQLAVDPIETRVPLRKLTGVNNSPQTGVESQPLCQSSVLAESSVDDLLADIEFPSGGPSPDGHLEHGPTFSSLTKVDRVKKPPKTGVESQPLYPSSVVVESSVDDLIADFDFLTTGPTSDGHVENGPTFSSLNESIDDLLSETSFDMGLEKQNPGGKFYEHLSL